MKHLTISPLPSLRPDEHPDSWLMERGGFVDEEVITAIMAKPLQIELAPVPRNRMLTSEDIDFAGWRKVPALEFLPPNELPIAEIEDPDAAPPAPDFSIVSLESPTSEYALELPASEPAAASPSKAEPVVRRATPPLMESEPESLPISTENSRWWLACLAGILTATAVALLLVHWISGQDSPFKSLLPGKASSVEQSLPDLESPGPASPSHR